MAQASKAIFGKSRESGCCGYRGGLVFKAHRPLYHSTQGTYWTCNESQEEEEEGSDEHLLDSGHDADSDEA